jgi:hypothetical protein
MSSPAPFTRDHIRAYLRTLTQEELVGLVLHDFEGNDHLTTTLIRKTLDWQKPASPAHSPSATSRETK